jgi:hypothetical protein
MTDMARESFVVTGTSGTAPETKAKASKPKKSKKKKASGCC